MVQTNFNVEIKGMKRLLTKANPIILVGPLRGLIVDMGTLAQREARTNAPRDTATLQRSIQLEVQPTFARIYTTLNYAPVMELGRRPGAKMPPPQALAGWARRHGYTGSLFVLARAIGRRGIKGRFFMKKASSAVRQALPERVRRMKDEIESVWGKQ